MPDISVPHSPNRDAPVPFVIRFLATGFFSGYSPITPGTAGSLVGLALYAIPGMETPVALSLSIVITLLIGVAASGRMEKQFGDDPTIVVIDEIVGMWVSLFFLPRTWLTASLAFFTFRMYDIIKPQPARLAERLRNGWGVMLDDVVAGAYANVTVRLVLFCLSGKL